MSRWNKEEGTPSLLPWLLGACLLLGSCGVLSWACGWAAVPVQVTSAENVRDQWAFAYSYDEALRAAARQVCSAEKALASSTTDEERPQRRSQLMAFEENYSRIQAEYNARLRNAFEAKMVAPEDVPKHAPSLEELKLQVCGE